MQEAELARCVATFRRWLYLPDPGSLLVTLASVAANRAAGDPLWLLLVAPPSGGKTETVGPLATLPDVYPAATLTEASLLSGTPNRDKAKGAKGGLLREIGDFGIIVCKDFGSVLSMNRDTRAAVLAALREVFDGDWTRHVGTDGGRTLHWSGKVGLIAGCTPAIDSHHAVIGAMGDRFVLYRLPEADGDQQADRAFEHAGREREMREELAHALTAVLADADTEQLTAAPTDDDRERLKALAGLVVRCRSAVERDPYSREVELIPGSEGPARLALSLLRLLNALRAIGTDEATAWAIVSKCGLDSMPAVRRTVLEALLMSDGVTTVDLSRSIGYPRTTTGRALEDLAAHKVLTRVSLDSAADLWHVSADTRRRWSLACPEKSVEVRNDGGEEDVDGPFTTPTRVATDKTGQILRVSA